MKRILERRKGQKVERSTVNTELKAIKRFFNRAVELNYLKDSPARKVKLLTMARKNPRFFSEAEASLIIETCEAGWVRDICITLLYTGLRIGELANLEWSDIDFEGRRILIRPKDFWKPKGNEERLIPMHDGVFYILLNRERKSRWIFTKADGNKINIQTLEARFRNQLIRLKISDVSLHTCGIRLQAT